MKYCGKCGESVANSTSKFCSNCFQSIEPSMQSPPVKEAPPVEQTSTTVEGSHQVPTTEEAVVGEQPSPVEEIPEEEQNFVAEEILEENQNFPAKEVPEEEQNFPAKEAPEEEQNFPTEEVPGGVAHEPVFNTYQSNETEDISKAFYTSDTGAILPVNRLDTATESKAKRNFLIPLLIGVGIIAALAATIGLVASGAFTSPVDRFIAIQRDHVINPYIAAIEEVEEVPISTDFTITATAQAHGGDLETLAILSILEQATLEINLEMSSDMTESLVGVNLSLLGEDLFSTIITTDEDYVGFYFPTLDGNYYIISLESLGGTGGLDFGFPVPDVTSEEMIAFIETYSDIILSIVHSDSLEVNRETISLFDGREELNARVYTLTPTEEDFVKLLDGLIQEFREDEFVYQIFAAQFDPWMLMFMGYESTAEAWQGILDEMENEIDDLAWEMADSGVIWRVATYRRQMILQEFYIPNAGFFRYEGFLGRGGHRTDWFTFNVEEDGLHLSIKNEMTANNQGAIGNLVFEFIQDSGRPGDFNISAVISYDMDFTTSSILDLPYGVYDLEINVDNNSFTGSLVVEEGGGGGSNHILSLYHLTDLQLSRLTLNIHTTDEPSNVQAPTVPPIDLSDMSYLELMMTLGGLMAELEELFSILEQL